jgi:hypothetical protein
MLAFDCLRKTHRKTTVGKKRTKCAMRWRQEGEKKRVLRADKKVECEKSRRNISGLRR